MDELMTATKICAQEQGILHMIKPSQKITERNFNSTLFCKLKKYKINKTKLVIGITSDYYRKSEPSFLSVG